MKTIAIIGFGFCGKMTFVNLVKKFCRDRKDGQCDKKFKILIFDKSFEGFVSSAFAHFSPHYILNVPAHKMSAFGDDEQDFCRFLEKKYPQILKEIGPDGFAPRQIYGEYLQQIIAETFALAQESNIDFELINQEIAAIKKDCGATNFSLTTTFNQKFHSDKIIVATSFKQSELPWKFAAKNLIKNLWSANYLDFHQRNFDQETICLIGSGLTAVDVIVGLKNRNFAGKIFVISRRGNFPQAHFGNLQINPNFISVADAKKGVLFLCLKVRKFLRDNPQFDLRHVVDSVKLTSQELWHNFDQKNKKLFSRFFCYWNIFRHRAPQKSMTLIANMVASKQLELKNGGVLGLSEVADKIIIKTRNGEIVADYVVNCLGFELSAKKYPLLNQMISCGLLESDLMMAQSNNCDIHLLGGLNIGKDFECTSVPDLRRDVEKLIALLCLD